MGEGKETEISKPGGRQKGGGENIRRKQGERSNPKWVNSQGEGTQEGVKP